LKPAKVVVATTIMAFDDVVEEYSVSSNTGQNAFVALCQIQDFINNARKSHTSSWCYPSELRWLVVKVWSRSRRGLCSTQFWMLERLGVGLPR
jgi:hypothetical protein